MNWAYVAGFTDGDGCICFDHSRKKDGRVYFSARVRWSQKAADSAVLDCIGDFLATNGLKVSSRNFSVARAGHKFPQRELGITNGEDTRRALHAMLPFLVVKRERAIEALRELDAVAELKQAYGNKYRAHQPPLTQSVEVAASRAA